MQQEGYKPLEANRDNDQSFFNEIKDEKFEKDLNELGQEGWEFVGQGMNDGVNNNFLIFKRPV